MVGMTRMHACMHDDTNDVAGTFMHTTASSDGRRK